MELIGGGLVELQKVPSTRTVLPGSTRMVQLQSALWGYLPG